MASHNPAESQRSNKTPKVRHQKLKSMKTYHHHISNTYPSQTFPKLSILRQRKAGKPDQRPAIILLVWYFYYVKALTSKTSQPSAGDFNLLLRLEELNINLSFFRVLFFLILSMAMKLAEQKHYLACFENYLEFRKIKVLTNFNFLLIAFN